MSGRHAPAAGTGAEPEATGPAVRETGRAALTRVAVGVEYDGRRYAGWQRQRHADSVQAHVERALSAVAGAPLEVRCAGRTDAGVHALGQVVHFDTAARRSPRSWVLGANSQLPQDIALRWARPVAADFDARRSALGRRYRYLILNAPARSALLAGRVTWEFRPLDLGAMQQAARALVGRHDFSAFRAQGCQARSPVRTVRQLTLWRQGAIIGLDIEADAFLMHMVRNIAGTLMAVGMGRAPVHWPAELLAGRDRARAGPTAAPDGLYLMAVAYPARYGLPAPAEDEPVLPPVAQS